MQTLSSIIVVTVLVALPGCSAARTGLAGYDSGGMYAEDGSAPDGGQACPPEGCDTDAGQGDAGAPDVDAGMDLGVIVMPDAGSPDAGSPTCSSPDVYISATGHCYHYIDPNRAAGIGTPGGVPETCAVFGMTLAWWTTAAEQHEIQALPFVGPGLRTDLMCTGHCSSGSYRWVNHPGESVLGVEWDGTSPLTGVSPVLIPSGMYAIDGSSSSRGYLCQSL
jgi:hypothetical protein